MRVAAIACAEGLGHAKRLIKIINCLADRTANFKVTLFCESWQITSLKEWGEYGYFCKRLDTEIVPVSLPMRWSLDQAYYGDWLCKWHSIISTWDLPGFDCVLSDNLVEPLQYTNRVILSGSFLWHDVLAVAFPANREVQRYKKWAEDIMLSASPEMIVNRHFAMPIIEQQARIFKIGLIHFCNTARNKPGILMPRNVLVAFGNAESANKQLEQVLNVLPVLNEAGAKVLCSPRCYRILSRHYANVEPYNFEDHSIDNIGLAIIRGGLGTISDCIAAKVPMVYIHDSNPEIMFNQKRLSDFGIGTALTHLLQKEDSPLINSHVYQAMVGQFSDFALQGEIDAANFLSLRWGQN